METILVNVTSKKDARFFLELINKMRFSAKVLSEEEKEDIALMKIMNERKNEKTFPIENAYRVLDNVK